MPISISEVSVSFNFFMQHFHCLWIVVAEFGTHFIGVFCCQVATIVDGHMLGPRSGAAHPLAKISDLDLRADGNRIQNCVEAEPAKFVECHDDLLLLDYLDPTTAGSPQRVIVFEAVISVVAPTLNGIIIVIVFFPLA